MGGLPWPPLEPPATHARFPDPEELGEEWVLGVTRTLSPGLVLQAYRAGIFPWPTQPGVIPWCSPEPRCVFPLDAALSWPRSVRRDRKAADAAGWEITFDEAYAEVMRACAARPEGTWITPDVFNAYLDLHHRGFGHSVEVWVRAGGGRALVGGLYGLAIGALFAGESMFHREKGASKVAFAALAERLRARGFRLFDVQAHSDHLASLGCVVIPRREYLARVRAAVAEVVAFDG
ncbi:MAG: leucyl/phenylalanyl-tRNA--protein transferase [Myxococcales bacterium]